MSDSFPDDLRKMEKLWATWRTGQRKYVALSFAIAAAPFIFLLTHLTMWASEYLTGKAFHDPREFMGGSYFLLLLVVVGGLVAYLEIKSRQRR